MKDFNKICQNICELLGYSKSLNRSPIIGYCVSTHFVLISMGCPRLVVIHKNKQLLLKKYFKKKPKNLSNLAISSNWLNFRGFWAFSQDRWVQSNFWLQSAYLPAKVLWIDTPHAYVLTTNIFHFSIDFVGWRHMQDWSSIKNFFTDQLL